ncbi:MAG: carboxypeptidase-like regulatory domain-containing protein, partial [Candidatus Sulfotelmatobacter sp.]
MSPLTGCRVVFVVIFSLLGTAFTQNSSGSIEGKVTDLQQAALAQTTIELEDSPGHTVAKAVADEAGHYRLTQVSPGTYTIRFNQAGFEPGHASVTVANGKATAFDVVLKPERVQEQVSVIAEPLTDIEPTGSRLDLPPLEI